MNNETLKALVKQEFGVSEGDLNLSEITTKTSGRYTTDELGNMFNSEGKAVGGYIERSTGGPTSMHIVPKYVGSKSLVDFRAVVGHEL